MADGCYGFSGRMELPDDFQTAEETINITDLWSDNVLVAYVNPADRVQFARCFILKNRYMRVRTWRNDELEGDFIEACSNYVFKVICPEAAYIFRDTLA